MCYFCKQQVGKILLTIQANTTEINENGTKELLKVRLKFGMDVYLYCLEVFHFRFWIRRIKLTYRV